MEILQPLPLPWSAFAIDILRLSMWLVLIMIIFVPLEKLYPLAPQKIFRKAFLTDLVYFFLSGLLPKLLLVAPISLIVVGLHDIISTDLHQQVGKLPFWLRFAAAMVIGELGGYWGHRWLHEIPWLWRFHAIHHSAEQLDWLVNTRAHPLDLVFPRLCGFLLMYLAGVAQPTASQFVLVPLLVVLLATVWGFFIHANVRWRFGWLELVISTPSFHHWHHANNDANVINKNYAAMLPWLDKLFGTFYLPKQQWPKHYGINQPISTNILVQLIAPFIRQKKH